MIVTMLRCRILEHLRSTPRPSRDRDRTVKQPDDYEVYVGAPYEHSGVS